MRTDTSIATNGHIGAQTPLFTAVLRLWLSAEDNDASPAAQKLVG
jgi:hypothetical protein